MCVRAFAYLVPTENLKELLSTFEDLPMSLFIKAFLKGKKQYPMDGNLRWYNSISVYALQYW